MDVWALGCILFALCFREHPFASESVLQILNASFTIPADSPYTPEMHTVIRAMLAPDPAERPAASRVLKVVQRLRALGDGAAPAAAEARGAAAASVASPPTPPDFSAGFSARTSAAQALPTTGPSQPWPPRSLLSRGRSCLDSCGSSCCT